VKEISNLDKWILSKTNSTIKKVTELADKYELPWIPGELRDFIVNDISRWYITLNREKLDIYSDDPDKEQVMAVLYEVLFKFLLMLAPINPMLAEELYLTMFKPHTDAVDREETKSIHLQDWPQFDESLIDLDLEEKMSFTRDLIEEVRALKDENRIRLRWPNKKILIEPKENMPDLEFADLIKQIGNIKELEIKQNVQSSDNLLKKETKYADVYLDISVDDDIIAERVVNDLIRNIQYARKKNSYNVGEEIALEIGTETDYLKHYVEQQKDDISEKVSATKFSTAIKQLSQDDDKGFGTLHICPNKDCSASLKENVISKLKKKKDVNCPYCETKLSEKAIKSIFFLFNRNE